MTLKDARKFVKEFNQDFGSPFLPESFARAYLDEKVKTLSIVIGDRDRSFILPDLRLAGAGTNIGAAQRWNIEPREGA